MARRSKGKANIRSATCAVKETATYLRFLESVQGKPRVVDRLCTALHTIHTATPSPANVKVEDLIDQVYTKANSMDETLGPRTKQQIHTDLSRLYRNKYIKFLPHRDDVEIIVLTPACKEMMEKLDSLLADSSATIEELSEVVVHRAICDFFRRTLQSRLRSALTRRELDLRNRELEFEREEYLQHLQNCPFERRSPSTAPTEIVGEPTEAATRDSMYFDDVSQVAVAVQPPTTPIRRSATLNNPEAYPSPESARRNILSQQPTTPPRSPFRRSPSVITPESFGDDPAPGDDEEMDVDVEVAPSTDLLLAPVDFHEECRAKVSRLEKDLQDERTNFAAEKKEWLLTLWARQAWSGLRLRHLTRENEDLQRENEVIKAGRKEEEQLVTLGRLSLGFTAQANSILGLTR